MNLPDPAPVLDLIEAFRRSKTMFTAVSLGVFDLLPADAASLASQTGTRPEPLARLLDGCAALGLLRKQDGVYSNEPVAETYLRRSSPRALTGYILYSDQVLFPMWAHLRDALREGSPRWQQTFGISGGIFSGFFKTDADAREFLRGMHGLGLLSSPAVAAAFDLSCFRRMADLGGATGHLVLAACERFPALEGVLFDLPNVIGYAREYLPPERIELVAGDFFRDPLPPADLYALGRILHDWPEEKIAPLLAKIHAALPPGGGLLVAEKLLADDGAGPLSANMQSLNMLVCTEGRERTPAEYGALLAAAGFRRFEFRRTGAPLDALLAIK
jgi:acetylserotonin N-methyltransferase